MNGETCAVETCDSLARSRGWCNTHYERWRLGRAVDTPGDLRHGDPHARCAIENCYGRPVGRGWCSKHYGRWARNGDPETTTRNYGAYRSITAQGYVRVWCPGHPAAQSDGYALEHRKVVIDAGIEIPDGFQVHHLNHNRTHNRLENLEVLSLEDHSAQHGLGCNQFVHAEGCRYGAAGWEGRL